MNGLTPKLAWKLIVAMFANAFMVIFGRDALLPSPVAGASGVVATVLLAFCLMSIARDDSLSS